MLLFAAATARFGWFMAHDPERAVRFFTFGQDPAFGKGFALVWSKLVGWFFNMGVSWERALPGSRPYRPVPLAMILT